MPSDDLDGLLLQAVAATSSPVTLVDPRRGDQPLIWVNEAFLKVTGYKRGEVIGRNCRFLQGPDTDPGAVGLLRDAVGAARSVTVTLVNYRKDGTRFWNRLHVSPLFKEPGDSEPVAFVGVQTDVSAQMEAENSLEEAESAERLARHDANKAESEAARARDHVSAVTDIIKAITPSLDPARILDDLGRSVVPRLADWVAFTLADDGDLHGAADLTVHRTGPDRPASAQLGQRLATDMNELSGSARILAGDDPFVARSFGEWRRGVRSQETIDAVAAVGLSSVMYVPLRGKDRIIGVMALVAASEERVFDQVDLDTAIELGRHAGLIVENALLYRREHRAAEALQRSLLPQLPELKDLDVGTVYLPADRHAAVGGDFYEALPLDDGSTVVAVGDVVGHDLSAAAAMGQLRSVLRSVVWTEAETGPCDPATVLTRLDALLTRLEIGPLATVLLAVLHPPAKTGGPWQLAYAAAGHPEALIRLPDGSVETLNQSQGLLLGTAINTTRHTATIRVPNGTTLLAFTDGLVERRNTTIEDRYEQIRTRLRSTPDLDQLLRRLTVMAEDDRTDDTAILAALVNRKDPPERVPVISETQPSPDVGG